jgi:Ni,Fe-hydrogenase I small subunit
LQYCAASAAALGLSQTDLLKLEKALASQGATQQNAPSVIWMTGQACSGCPVSLLNRVNSYETNPYYDADMINAVYGAGLTNLPGAIGNDPAGLPLQVVNDAADLLVGDAVRALTGITRSNLWSDDLGGVLPGSLLDAYIGDPCGLFGTDPGTGFPQGFINLEWNSTVMAAAGDIPAEHLRNIRNGGGLLGAFVLVVDGAIPHGDFPQPPAGPSGDLADAREEFCWVFDNYTPSGGRVVRESDPMANGASALSIPYGVPVSVADSLRWLAGAPGCLAVISQGTCAAFGGIPGAVGNKTNATSVADFLAGEGISTPVVNVPGCPPHPDWTVYTVAYVLAQSTISCALNDLSLAVPPVDTQGRPIGVYSGSTGDTTTPFCMDCANKAGNGPDGHAVDLGDPGCLGNKGCKGPYVVGDCPVRGKNTSDDGYSMNWCVGASGDNLNGNTVSHIGEARHPCQGCIDKRFPDWSDLALSEGERTSKKIKGFYNS